MRGVREAAAKGKAGVLTYDGQNAVEQVRDGSQLGRKKTEYVRPHLATLLWHHGEA